MKPVTIDLDQGQQILIEGDTVYKQIRSDDPDPTKCLLLEHGGRCVAFTFEDNVWWQGEYTGDANRIPRLNIKYQATGEEKEERERARRRWEQEQRRTECVDYAQQHPAAHAGQSTPVTSMWDNQSCLGCDNGTSNGSRGYPHAPALTQTVQMQFPTAGVENANRYLNSEPTTDFGRNPGRYGQPQWHNPWQSVTQSRTQLWPDQRTYHPSRDSTPSPHFPEALPFSPASPPHFLTTPSPYAEEQTPFAHGTRGRTRIDGGVYLDIGGRADDRNVDTSINISGQQNYVNISPDYHQELNGCYVNGPWDWPR